MKVNLFSENRAEFLGLAVTDTEGNFGFDLAAPTCGVITFIAPAGETFVSTAGRFRNRQFCAVEGQDVGGLDATILSVSAQATLAGQVVESAGPGVAGVKIVLYRANADGSRGQWLRPTVTDVSGGFSLSVGSGCYVLDFVAPTSRSWVSTGRRFQQLSVCVEANQAATALDGALS